MRKWIGMLALAAAVTAAHAQIFRQLPANGQLAELTGQQPYPLLKLNDKTARLAPGGRIYNENNRLLVHGALPASATVLFVPDMRGEVSRLYILRADELARIKQRQQQQQK